MVQGAFHPEDRARSIIDRRLVACGWLIQSKSEINLGAGIGVAVREFQTASGPVDYGLFVGRRLCGVIEAKPEGTTLSGFSEQAARYIADVPKHLVREEGQVRFEYVASGTETLFRDHADPDPTSRLVFAFHRPATLELWLKEPATLRARLLSMPAVVNDGLRACQIDAVSALESSMAANRPRALVQMATGAGKTFTACTLSYRLLAHAGFKRILFLADRANLVRQTRDEFLAYRPPGTGRSFSEIYNVQKLGAAGLDKDAQVVVATIQRVFSVLSGKDLAEEEEEASSFESASADTERLVGYNPSIPIESFDLVITDECHRSIYGTWRQVLEYFDAFTVGLTATPSLHTLGFFGKNLVAQYPYERSVVDGVNVDFEVFRIRTEIGERGATVKAGYDLPVRDKRTRAERYETLSEDFSYTPDQIDRSVLVPNQIRTVLETYRDTLFSELFPGRKEVPKTLVFAKDDHHAEEIVGAVREVFGKGNDFAKKITYRTDGADPETLSKQRGIIGAIFLKAQNEIQDPAKLKRLVGLIDSETWLGLPVDVKGDIYEGLLARNAEDVKSGAGQYFTPRPVIEAMVNVVDPEPHQTIHDPACGTAGFLLAAWEHMKQHPKARDRAVYSALKGKFSGVDIVPEVVRLAAMNLYLHGITGVDSIVEAKDALLGAGGKSYDVILTNPPFGKKQSYRIVRDDGEIDSEREDYDRQDFFVTTSNKQLNFLQHIMTVLAPNGEAAVVLPDNVLFEGGAGETIRRRLLRNFDFHTLLRLPTGIFYKQGVKANVLFFDKKPPSDEATTKDLWIYDLRTNQRFTLKERPMVRTDLDDFIVCYRSGQRFEREETEKFRRFPLDALLARDKVNLDIFWLKDDALDDPDLLPPPDEVAAEIVESLEIALQRFRSVAAAFSER